MWAKVIMNFVLLNIIIMASINLLLQSKISPAGIYIRLRDGRDVDIKTKTNYNIDPVNWDKSNQH